VSYISIYSVSGAGKGGGPAQTSAQFTMLN
jgi:hypothetical protein